MKEKQRNISIGLLVVLMVGLLFTTVNYAGGNEIKGREKRVRNHGALPKVESLTHLLGMLEQSQQDTNKSFGITTLFENAVQDAAGDAGAVNGESESYSSTNVQVNGVDEGDIIKTDGKYIYTLKDNSIQIFKADKGNLSLESKIDMDSEMYGNAIYVSGDRLVCVSERYEYEETPYTSDRSSNGIIADCIIMPGKSFSAYTVYDITDRKNPKQIRCFELEGYTATTRLMDGALYFAVNKSIWYNPKEYELPDILPLYRDSREETNKYMTVDYDQISYFPGKNTYNGYLMIGMMNLDGDDPVIFESFLDNGSDFYMNMENLYITRSNWNTSTQKTDIYRFSIGEEGLQYEGEGSVNGYVLNQYSMDEYDKHFRIATTLSGKGNFISVLNQDLELVGSTPALAEDETIQSVRFMGSMAYMVTYRQTDPLYAVDLSVPQQPEVLDALKIPGFSTYLHPVGEGLLVGFGRHTTETYVKNSDGTEQVVGTRDMGAKVSLFDISNPRELKEIDVMLLGDSTEAEAFTNPRALMVNSDQNLFGFFVGDWKDGEKIKLISVASNKLQETASIENQEKGDNYYGYSYGCRLLYIGNVLYAMDEGNMKSYDMNSWNLIDSVPLVK